MNSTQTSDGQESQAGELRARHVAPFPSSNMTTSSNQAVYFRSRKIVKGSTERPWLGRIDPREKWLTIIPLLGILIGLGVGGYLIWDGVRGVVKHTYCQVLDEDWSHGFDANIWMREVEVGGFG
jgi:hypothetical protein